MSKARRRGVRLNANTAMLRITAQCTHIRVGKRVTNSAKQGELRLFKAVFDAKKRVFVHGIVRVSLYKMRKVLALISW